MLEKPALPDSEIIAALRADYGLNVTHLAFLPLGADSNTAVYRAATSDGADYFVKLRSGDFNVMTVVIPKLLHDQGCRQLIPPLLTRSQQLWTTLHHYTLALFPFIAGEDGYSLPLSAEQWRELGRVLKQLHSTAMPVEWEPSIPRESYSAQWREAVIRFQALAERAPFADPVAAQLAALLRRQRAVIDQLISGAARYATLLHSQAESSSQQQVLCHGDIHAGNVLIGADSRLYVVDWDTLILAPKERDLMFVGGGLFAGHRSPQEEEALFYQGYGATEVDLVALSYYRYERIVQDIAAYCEQIFLRVEGGEDREVGLHQLASQFLPNGIVEIALGKFA